MKGVVKLMAFREIIRKEVQNGGSPFQENHVYILHGVIPARKNIVADTEGELDGSEGGIVLRLVTIEESGTHIFHGLVYDRSECKIKLEGYTCEYKVSFEDLDIQDFEDITDDIDYAELLQAMEENEKIARPYLMKTNIRSILIEKSVGGIALLLLFIFMVAISMGVMYLACTTAIPRFVLMACFILNVFLAIITISIVGNSVFDGNWLPAPLDSIYIKIEEKVNEKDEGYLETIYQKNDTLMQEFVQKKHLEKIC